MHRIWIALSGFVALVGGAAKAETSLLAPDTPWRAYLVCSQQDRHRKGPVTYTAAPPAGWVSAEFDDSGWGRYGTDLYATIGGYGFDQPASTAMLCLRTGFGISDPSAARDLALSIEYRGGAIVYVNGQEIARANVPAGRAGPGTPATECPAEALTDPAGAQLPKSDRPAEEHLARYEQRIRKLSIAIPPAVLRKGSNVLAIELHAAPTTKMQLNSRMEWSTAGLCDVKLVSKSGAGVTGAAEANQKTTFWNATPMDTIAVTPGKRQAGFLWWGATITPSGLARGNPFEPLRPIRAVAPRGGTCSGQVVVSSPEPIKGMSATISTLTRAGGGAIPADAVRIAYASQAKGEVFCNALLPRPVDGAAVQPVWVLIDVPRDQAPGWYGGTLSIKANGQSESVPVQVLVAGWTLTDPKDNATLVCMYQSPDTLAEHFKVEPWSDAHFALIEKSMRSMALAGNDVVLVPIVLDNYLHHKTGMIRWVRQGGAVRPDFSVLERYLDLHAKVFGRPKVVTLSVWKHDFGTRTWFRGMRSDTVKPCMVSELDPATGKCKPMQAPHFGQPGSEEFWKTMIEGARKVVRARGIDDRFLLLGEAFDSRPLEAHASFFKEIEPTMRWQIYSHFDGGEPAPKDGKFVCLGGFEVGFRINPNGGGLPEFSREWPKVAPSEYRTAQVQRVGIHATSSPLSYRLVIGNSGTIARIGLDFWPMYEERGRARSYYGCPPNEGWLWRGHVPSLTAAGPDGAVRTTRAQMFLEGVQECEARIALLRARQKASPEMAGRIDTALARRREASLVGTALSQAMISLDLNALAAQDYALCAELAGQNSPGDWAAPPAIAGGAR